ncbi:plasmalemma vesicle-associated protein [Rhynchocyon petersi]
MGLIMERAGPYSRSLHKSVSNQHGCWYYLRYFFLFVSLIQFLIILGLVLFMVYGNVHVGTESNLQATERRADGLYGQVVGLSAANTNLTKELNLTARSKENIMQMLLGARRDLDRINASFRQCQADRVSYLHQERYMAAIILSEQQCQEQLKKNNNSCDALLFAAYQKAKTIEVELAKEKVLCTKDRETLALSKQMLGDQLTECSNGRSQLQQEQRITQERLRKVEALCLLFNKDKFETDLRNLWRDSIIPRFLDSLNYPYHPLNMEPGSVRKSCDNLPTLMSMKVAELTRTLRMDIEQVTRENAELQRQKLEVERSLNALQAAKEAVEKEAHVRESSLQKDCARQTQLTLEEKATLRKERDNLAKELEERKKEVEHLKVKLAVGQSTLDTCIKAKFLLAYHSYSPLPVAKVETFLCSVSSTTAQCLRCLDTIQTQSVPFSGSRPPVPVPNPQPIDPASLEEFKKKILESQRSSLGNAAAPPRTKERYFRDAEAQARAGRAGSTRLGPRQAKPAEVSQTNRPDGPTKAPRKWNIPHPVTDQPWPPHKPHKGSWARQAGV